MKLTAGFMQNLVATRWFLNANHDALFYSIDNTPIIALSYLDLRSITMEHGLIRYKLQIDTSNERLEFAGISQDNCIKFIKEVKRFAGMAIAENISKEASTIRLVIPRLQSLITGETYLNQAKLMKNRDYCETYKIGSLFRHPFYHDAYIPEELQAEAKDFHAIMVQNNGAIQKHNDAYIARKKAQYKQVFDEVEKYPLTDEQREAVITEEDNVLLVAAAGSGKSSTLVAKILYLLQEGHYQPEQIISFAYNKDAQVELTTRIDALFKRFGWTSERVPARTFHGFCMDVLASANKEKPTISPVATGSKTQQLNFFIQLIEQLKQSNPIFKVALLNYYSVFKFPAPLQSQIQSSDDYNDYLKTLEGKGSRDPDTGELCVSLLSMNGVEVKSLEELRIANWLFLNGIRFEYERVYDQSTADENHRQYYPDFYYPDIDVWHEHFAIDKEGKAPDFMIDYEAGVEWKRELHKEKETNLIETHSAHFQDGTVFERLDKALTDADVPRNPPSAHDVDALIGQVFNPSRDLELLITFLKHFKTNNLTLDAVKAKIGSHDPMRARMFIQLFEYVYLAYQSVLKEARQIDFEDLIHQASAHIASGTYKSPYKYILVDEFQDASQDRLRLIKALISQQEDVKLFCVGDDWQSIYRFTGADLKVMTAFSELFGFTKQLQLTQTFRSVQQIVDVASEFVQRNPDQFNKVVKAIDKANQAPVILRPYDIADPDKCLEGIIQGIQNKAARHAVNVSVFILTRYVAQKPSRLSYLSAKYPHVDVEWKTIHASKGLEADYVIIHHMNRGSFGFPSENSDDPLLNLVIPEKESYKYAEERRLLYVALTRAKRAVFGFYDPSKPSAFIRELGEIKGVKVYDQRYDEAHEANQTCPKCGNGVITARVGSNGIFLGCNTYPDCRFTADIRCPECKIGKIRQRHAKDSGKAFYACDQFPVCKHVYKLPRASKSRLR